MAMRERGIYKAPDGKKYVASKGPDNMYFLFDLTDWMNYGAVGLRVNHDGTVSRKGEFTSLRIEQFVDTGRTADPPPQVNSTMPTTAIEDGSLS